MSAVTDLEGKIIGFATGGSKAEIYLVGSLVCMGAVFTSYLWAYDKGYDAAMAKVQAQGDKAQLILDRLASGDVAAAQRAADLQATIAAAAKRSSVPQPVKVVTVYPPGCNTSQAVVDQTNAAVDVANATH